MSIDPPRCCNAAGVSVQFTISATSELMKGIQRHGAIYHPKLFMAKLVNHFKLSEKPLPLLKLIIVLISLEFISSERPEGYSTILGSRLL